MGESTMGDPVIYIDRFQLKEGKTEDFTSYATELTELVKEKEPRALSYEYFLGDDGSGTAVFVFGDAEAVDLHLELARSLFMRGHEMLEHAEIELLGAPSAQASEMAKSFGGVVKPRIVGFRRSGRARAE